MDFMDWIRIDLEDSTCVAGPDYVCAISSFIYMIEMEQIFSEV